MISGKPTPQQEKDWLARITDYAKEHGAFPLYENFDFDRHHVKGREFKHNKVAIGRWFVIPVMRRYHDVHSNSSYNVTHWPKRYAEEFGKQVDQFRAMCAVIKDEDGELPFNDDVMHAIMDLNL